MEVSVIPLWQFNPIEALCPWFHVIYKKGPGPNYVSKTSWAKILYVSGQRENILVNI